MIGQHEDPVHAADEVLRDHPGLGGRAAGHLRRARTPSRGSTRWPPPPPRRSTPPDAPAAEPLPRRSDRDHDDPGTAPRPRGCRSIPASGRRAECRSLAAQAPALPAVGPCVGRSSSASSTRSCVGAYYAFLNYAAVNPDPHFIWFENFKSVLGDQVFWQSVQVTADLRGGGDVGRDGARHRIWRCC